MCRILSRFDLAFWLGVYGYALWNRRSGWQYIIGMIVAGIGFALWWTARMQFVQCKAQGTQTGYDWSLLEDQAPDLPLRHAGHPEHLFRYALVRSWRSAADRLCGCTGVPCRSRGQGSRDRLPPKNIAGTAGNPHT